MFRLGTTNRAEGVQIIVTVTGPVELTPKLVRVENGTFNATFDTSAAPEGTYVIKVDDGDGHTAEAMMKRRCSGSLVICVKVGFLTVGKRRV